MKTVLFLTNAYPYFPGEQFIEDEIGYWAVKTSVKVILVPMVASGSSRNKPAGIDVDLTLAQSTSSIKTLTSLVAALISKIFWKEVQFIYSSQGLKLRCYAQALKSLAKIFQIEEALKKIHAKHERIDVVYCYWNEVQSYAAVLLKRAGLVPKVFSRAHGFDVYEVRRPNGYMPLKRQFIGEIDTILAISSQGKSYLEKTYNAPFEKVVISPLGVPIPTLISLPGNLNSLNLVSVSFCIPVKRIDKIIDAIAEAALKIKFSKITWTHIGDGPLLPNLKLRAAEKLNSLKIECNFLGNKQNAEVKKYFQENSVDIFLNASESEGVPVSIMEAMSYGISVIAPNVGGVSELVSNEYGHLLSENPSVADIADAILNMIQKCKQSEIKAMAKQKIVSDYSADRNYQALVNLVTS